MKKLLVDIIAILVAIFCSVVAFFIFVFIGWGLGLKQESAVLASLAVAVVSFFFIARAIILFMRNEYLEKD